MQIFLFFSLLIAILAVIFALQNSTLAQITFLVWNFEGSLALVLLAALVAGILVSFLASLPALIRSGLRISSQKKKLAEMEASLADYQRLLAEAQKPEGEETADEEAS